MKGSMFCSFFSVKKQSQAGYVTKCVQRTLMPILPASFEDIEPKYLTYLNRTVSDLSQILHNTVELQWLEH